MRAQEQFTGNNGHARHTDGMEAALGAVTRIGADIKVVPRKKQADVLIELASDATLFHSPDGDIAYATVLVAQHRETWPVDSKRFRRWLTQQFYDATRKSPNKQAIVEAVGVLEARALFLGPAQQVFVRFAGVDGRIYLDLINATRQVVEITPTGWRVCADAPVNFLRRRGMLSLPTPQPGGHIDDLRRFLNVGSDADWYLLVAWVLAALRPTGPYPVLVIHGAQGSAKSTTTKVLRKLVDPATAPLRSEPTNVRDVMIAAGNAWCLAYDNLSNLTPALSDAFCRLATGGGFGTRQLYTDQEEWVIDAQRPMVLNGIEELATRGDLLDRALLLYLPNVAANRRRTEANFWLTFDAVYPRILGALLDVVSTGLRNLPTIHLGTPPRMADFAEWVSACEPALGWPRGSFMAAYTSNQRASYDLTLEASSVAGPLRRLAETLGDQPWAGNATALLRRLEEFADDRARRSHDWPSSPRVLSNVLRRLAPTLRAVGVEAIPPDVNRREGGTGNRLWRLQNVAPSIVTTVTGDPEEGPPGP